MQLEPAPIKNNNTNNSSHGGSAKIKQTLMITWIVHAIAFIFALIHWITFWQACPVKLPSGFGSLCKPVIKEANKVVYPWFLLIVWILWIVAIAVNFLID